MESVTTLNDVLEDIAYHNKIAKYSFSLYSKNGELERTMYVEPHEIDEKLERFKNIVQKNNYELKCSSEVELAGGNKAHLMLIDFCVDKTDENVRKAIYFIKSNGLDSGFFVDGNKAIQFYSKNICDSAETLGKKIAEIKKECSPMIDIDWTRYCLMNKRAEIQVMTPKNTTIPSVAARIR